ncbi:unnamed protein product, partial [Mesorhabditis spiculigera]
MEARGEESAPPRHPKLHPTAEVGQQLLAGNTKYVLKKKIGMGGYADVFLAKDSAGKSFAVKLIKAYDLEAEDATMVEMMLCQRLSSHPCIPSFVHSGVRALDRQPGKECTIITEYCDGGDIAEFLKVNHLTYEQIIRIIYAVTNAVAHMHSLGFTHRDVKPENLLIDAQGRVKLCDFGSATRESHQPYDGMPAAERVAIQEKFQKYTTPMYRPPEVLETYNNYPIGNPLDVWALGCVLYSLCFRIHPFEDSAVTRICRVQVLLSREPLCAYNEVFKELIMPCLEADPRKRPLAQEFAERLANFAQALNIEPEGSVIMTCTEKVKSASPVKMRKAATLPPGQSIEKVVEHKPATSQNGFKSRGMTFLRGIKGKTATMLRKSNAHEGLLAVDSPAKTTVPILTEFDVEHELVSDQELRALGVVPTSPLTTDFEPITAFITSSASSSVDVPSTESVVAQQVSTEKLQKAVPLPLPSDFVESEPELKPKSIPAASFDGLSTDPDFTVSSLQMNPPPLESVYVKENTKQKLTNFEAWDGAHLRPRASPSAFSHVSSNCENLASSSTSGSQHWGSTKNETYKKFSEPWPKIDRPVVGPARPKTSFADFFTDDKSTDSVPNKPKAMADIRNLLDHRNPTLHHKPSFEAAKPKKSTATFDDLLAAQGYDFTSNKRKKTLAEGMKEAENRNLDPTTIKIRDWTSGKQGNIRAMLCSLNDVLWEGASKWDQPTMGDIFDPYDVKKHYRKACLIFHPDKQIGKPHHELATAIFTELNIGWKAFEATTIITSP